MPVYFNEADMRIAKFALSAISVEPFKVEIKKSCLL